MQGDNFDELPKETCTKEIAALSNNIELCLAAISSKVSIFCDDELSVLSPVNFIGLRTVVLSAFFFKH